MTLPVIIDCDPGQDDALMLFLALNAPELNIRGIISVGGNVPLAKTSRNLAMLVEIAGRGDLPLYEGCAGPMVGNLVTAEYVHGETGINGLEIFEPKIEFQAQHGVDFLIEALRDAKDNEIVLVPTGPLTNIAMALIIAPDIATKIKQIVLMGGAMREGGNTTPSAEFNIYVDPHAADVVMRCGRPIVMFGLDVTHQVMTTPERIATIRAQGNRVSNVSADMLEFFGKYDREKYGGDGGPLHDPCTIAWLLEPEMFKLKSCHVEIETKSKLTLGHTAVDFWHVTNKPENALWAWHVEAESFFELLSERLGRYG